MRPPPTSELAESVPAHSVKRLVSTYRVSVHESEDPIRPENGSALGWIEQERNIPHMALRSVVRQLRSEGYEDEAILVEREHANSLDMSNPVSPDPVGPKIDHDRIGSSKASICQRKKACPVLVRHGHVFAVAQVEMHGTLEAIRKIRTGNVRL